MKFHISNKYLKYSLALQALIQLQVEATEISLSIYVRYIYLQRYKLKPKSSRKYFVYFCNFVKLEISIAVAASRLPHCRIAALIG